MSPAPNWIITAEQLRNEIKDVLLVDVRQPEEFDEAHIEGCVLIPLGELEERASKELDANRKIVCYCAHGIRSLDAAMALRMLGFKDVRSLQGGIEAWLNP